MQGVSNKHCLLTFFSFCLLMTFADNLCKQIGPRSSTTVLSGLIWFQTVCKCNQQVTLGGKELEHHLNVLFLTLEFSIQNGFSVKLCQVPMEMLNAKRFSTVHERPGDHLYNKKILFDHYYTAYIQRNLIFTKICCKCGTIFCHHFTINTWLDVFIYICLLGPIHT